MRAWTLHPRTAALAACAALALAACGDTTDSLGYDQPGGGVLHPVTGPATYPNAFRDVLGKTDAEITAKIAAAFQQLFHGDPSQEAIYYPVGTDRAIVFDVLHGDVRTEGMGFGMLVAVELDKQDEFDRLWRWVETELMYSRGPQAGYAVSVCDTTGGTTACVDPFGLQQIAISLLFAHDRWGDGPTGGGTSYADGVRALFDVMLHKEEQNGGVVDDVTDVFDRDHKLVSDFPTRAGQGIGRPSIEMPAYYDLWAQATTDPFWTDAAAQARLYWQQTAHPTTGLVPIRARFDGGPSQTGWDRFSPEGYRTQLNLVLDKIWSGGGAAATWEVTESDRMLAFFSAQGIEQYGRSYSVDGTMEIDSMREPSLVVTNGMTGLISTRSDRATYINDVWNLAVPTGVPRYYTGILHLLGLMVLGGQLRVY